MSQSTVAKKRAFTIVDVNDLQENTREFLRRVETSGETIQIVDKGRVVAFLVSSLSEEQRAARDAQTAAIWANLDALAQQIGKEWPKGLTAVEAIRQDRDRS